MKERLQIIHSGTAACREEMREEVWKGLTARQKYLPCKYFYDSYGSELFERICSLPEYYQTRTEMSILQAAAPAIMSDLKQVNLIELGSGANWKIRTLLDAANGAFSKIRYVPVDVCEHALKQSAEDLNHFYPDLEITGIVGDFRDVHTFPEDRERVVAFFGSTIGNLSDEESNRFLKKISARFGPSDRLLLGIDMIKQKKIIEAAYNDSQGITARFNKNILTVINRELHALFDLSAFDHFAFYDEKISRIEMHLRAKTDIQVPVAALGINVTMKRGETILTEISRKFNMQKMEAMAVETGFRMNRWFTDCRGWFALAELLRA